jgi:uncharacterized membrane protein YfcA
VLSSTFFQTPAELIAACLVVALAQLVYVTLGFGTGLVAVGGLALLFPDLRDVVVMLLLVNLPVETTIVARSRRTIEWRGVLRICIGIAVGIPLGAAVLRFGDAELLLLTLGVSLIVVGLVFLMLRTTRQVRWPAWVAPPVGLLSGTLTGLFGTGGPPLVVYYQLSRVDKATFRGNLMAIFLLKTFVRVPAYLVAGLITADRLLSSAMIFPAALVGAWFGHRIHVEISEALFRRLVAAALVVVGVLLVSRRLLAGP